MRVRVRVQIHCAEEDRALGPRVRFNSLARVRRATHAVTEHLVDARDHPVEAEAVERLEQALQRRVGLARDRGQGLGSGLEQAMQRGVGLARDRGQGLGLGLGLWLG